MNHYKVTFYYDSLTLGRPSTFSENAMGNDSSQVAAVIKSQLEKSKFIEYPGGLIPVSCIGEISIEGVE